MPHTIPIVIRAMDVLDALALGPATCPGLARALHIAPTSCYRILQTLAGRGWVQRGMESRFYLAAGLLPIASALASADHLTQTLRPIADQLAIATGLTAAIFVRAGDDALCLSCSLPSRPAAVVFPLHTRLPLLVGGPGACLLATMSESDLERLIDRAPAAIFKVQTRADLRRRIAAARTTRVLLDVGASHPQLTSLSVPIIAAGQTRAALTLVGLPREFTPRHAARFRRTLLAAARAGGRL